MNSEVGKAGHEALLRRLDDLRMRHADRSRLLLNAKRRVIGVDVEGLDAQVEEKAAAAADENAAKDAYDKQVVAQAAAMREQESEYETARRQSRAATENFWKLQIKTRPLRAEHDLSDPKQRAKDSLPTPETAGPSSCQFVAGIPDTVEIKRNKQAMQRSMIDSVAAEVEAKLAEEAAYKASCDAAVKLQVKARHEAEEKAAENRRERARHTLRVNEELAAQKRERAAAAAALDSKEAEREHVHIRDHRMLLEKRFPDAAGGVLGRVVCQEWKGMVPSQLAKITTEQGAIMEINQTIVDKEKEWHMACDNQYEASRQMRVAIESQAQADRRVAAKAVQGTLDKQKAIYKVKKDEQRSYDIQPQPTWFPFGQSL